MQLWTNVLREARNGIHFEAKPTSLSTYEKVMVLFLEGASSFSKLYRIRAAALSHPS